MTPFRVLIVEDSKDVQGVLAFYLESSWSAEVTRASHADEAIAILTVDPKFALVISDYNMPQGNGDKLFRYVIGMEKPIPFVLCSHEKANEHPEFRGPNFLGGVEKPYFLDPLHAILQKAFVGKAKHQMTPGVYCRIPLPLLHKLNTLPCDLFVRLSEKKFVKVMNENDVFSDVDLDRFSDKGMLYLHVETVRTTEVLNKIIRALAVQTEMAIAQRSSHDGLEISSALQTTINDLASSLGYDVALEAAVKANLEVTYKFIQNSPGLHHLLQNGVFKKDNYICSHSVLLPYVCFKLADLLDWQSELTFQKLTLTSFLHDATLHPSINFEINGEEDTDKLTPDQAKSWLDHTEKAARIARRFKEIPPDVDVIIAQHHELPDGTGFPNKLHHTRIAPLSALFIVSHDFLIYFERTGKADLYAFATENEAKYNHGHFKRIIRTIIQKVQPRAAA